MSEPETHHDRKEDSSRGSFWLIAIPLLPILYALSAGPAVALMVRFEFLEDSIAVIYYPLEVTLEALLDTSWGTPLEPYIEMYVEWWARI